MNEAIKIAVANQEIRQRLDPLRCLVVVARHHRLDTTVEKLVHDNLLSSEYVSLEEMVRCAERIQMQGQIFSVDWDALAQMQKALPAIVEMRSGDCFVLHSVETRQGAGFVRLQDPSRGEDGYLVVDRLRFQHAWSGRVVALRRDYKIDDEEQPFGMRFVASLIFRERRLARDIAISALMMGFLTLTPILFYQILASRVLSYNAFSTFGVVCVGMLFLIVFEALFSYMRGYILNILTMRVDVKLSEHLFNKVLGLPIDFFERTQIGEIAHDMNEVWRIRSFLMGQLFGTMLDSVALLFLLPVMVFISPLLTALVLVFCAAIVAWLLIMLPQLRRLNAAVIRAETERGSFLYQTLAGSRTVKSLSLETRQSQIWDLLVARVAKARQTEAATANVVAAIVRLLERFSITAPYAIGVYMAMTSADPTSAVTLFAFLMLSQRVAAPLMQMAQLITSLDEARMAVAIVRKLVTRPSEPDLGGLGVKLPIQGEIAFDQVGFTYPGSHLPALVDMSFVIRQGMTIGLVGKSGSGKSTVTRLLQRLHTEYEGQIRLDGVELREYDLAHLRRSFGIVLQENFLFSGTIRENISIAKPSATFEEIAHAARLAGAEEFIDRLPRGYETYIYEGSPNLSGGQRQRLAIARALIRDPRILLLDEATSALDPDSEAIVNANIKRIAAGRTVLIVSHRLSSLVNSDAILVLDRGRLVDFAPHEELLRRCDIYSSLWRQQNAHTQTAQASPVLVARSVRGAM